MIKIIESNEKITNQLRNLFSIPILFLWLKLIELNFFSISIPNLWNFSPFFEFDHLTIQFVYSIQQDFIYRSIDQLIKEMTNLSLSCNVSLSATNSLIRLSFEEEIHRNQKRKRKRKKLFHLIRFVFHWRIDRIDVEVVGFDLQIEIIDLW